MLHVVSETSFAIGRLSELAPHGSETRFAIGWRTDLYLKQALLLAGCQSTMEMLHIAAEISFAIV
jgi:hypothetical protein